MSLFEFDGPSECLGNGCVCSSMTIESITEEGGKLVARGAVTILDTVKYGQNYDGLWTAEFFREKKTWLVYRPKDPTCKIFDKDGNPEFLFIIEVNVAVKDFVANQLKIFCFHHTKIEIDPDDDLPPNKVRTSSGRILLVQGIL